MSPSLSRTRDFGNTKIIYFKDYVNELQKSRMLAIVFPSVRVKEWRPSRKKPLKTNAIDFSSHSCCPRWERIQILDAIMEAH